MVRLDSLLILSVVLVSTPAGAQLPSAPLRQARSTAVHDGPSFFATLAPRLPEGGIILHDAMGSRNLIPLFSHAPASASHKSPFLAWFLSIVIPGAGQGYNGQWGKAAAFFGAAVVGLAASDPFCGNDCGGEHYLGGALLTASWVASQIDAPITAARINKTAQVKTSALPQTTILIASFHF